MAIFPPRNAYEAAWQQWNYGGGASRGEPAPRPENYPDVRDDADWRYSIGPVRVNAPTSPSPWNPSPSSPAPWNPSSVPNRGTQEASLNDWNRAMRQSPVYQAFMRSHGLPTDGRVKLSRQQQVALEAALAAQGIRLPSSMHIDQGGNLNQKNRTGRNVAIGAGVTLATLATMGAAAGAGPLGFLHGGATMGAAVVPSLPAAATAGMIPMSTAGTVAPIMTAPAIAGFGTAGIPALPAGVTPGVGGSMAAGGAGTANLVRDTVAPSAGRWIGRGDNATNLISTGANLFTTYMGNRARGRADDLALAENTRQFDATQAFLREEAQRRRDEFDRTEAEKKRQWDAEQVEKKRQWDYQESEKRRIENEQNMRREPYREAGRTSLASLMNWSRPASVAYQPSFTYRP